MFKKLFKNEFLERKKLSKKYSTSSKDYKIESLKLDMKYKGLSEEDYLRAVCELNYHKDSQDYRLTMLDIDRKFNKIGDYNFEIEKNNILVTAKQKHALNELDIKLKYNKISKDDYEKEVATIKKEPYIKWKKWSIKNGELEFELDWNDYMIKYLNNNGYNQPDENEVIMQWVKDTFNEIYENDEAIEETIAETTEPVEEKKE